MSKESKKIVEKNSKIKGEGKEKQKMKSERETTKRDS